MAVRSRRLWGPTRLSVGGNVATSVFVVPPDRTAIVRRITLPNASNTAAAVRLRLNGVGTGANITGLLNVVGNAPTPQEVAELYLVMNPGDTLYYVVDVANALVITGFGSLLDGAPE